MTARLTGEQPIKVSRGRATHERALGGAARNLSKRLTRTSERLWATTSVLLLYMAANVMRVGTDTAAAMQNMTRENTAAALDTLLHMEAKYGVSISKELMLTKKLKASNRLR